MKIRKLISTVVLGSRAMAARALSSWRSHQKKPWRVQFTAKSLIIVVRDNQQNSGGIYQIPRSSALLVIRKGALLSMNGEARLNFDGQARPGTDISFACEEDAVAALSRIERRIMSNRTLVWAGRVALLGLTWLLLSSYMQVRAKQQLEAQSSAPTQALAALPDVAAPLQEFPSLTPPNPPAVVPSPAKQDLSGFGLDVTGQATLPAPAAASEAAGQLAGFGLDAGIQPQASAPGTGPAQPPQHSIKISAATTAAIAASAVNGPGCDPDLAFKAPAR